MTSRILDCTSFYLAAFSRWAAPSFPNIQTPTLLSAG